MTRDIVHICPHESKRQQPAEADDANDVAESLRVIMAASQEARDELWMQPDAVEAADELHPMTREAIFALLCHSMSKLAEEDELPLPFLASLVISMAETKAKLVVESK